MLTVMVDLGINLCCSINIDLSMYYICTLLYYWDDIIAQIMYLYCSDTTNRYHFCMPLRCNANGERLMWLFLYKYYGYIRMIMFDVEPNDHNFCIVTDMYRECRFLNFIYKSKI